MGKMKLFNPLILTFSAASAAGCQSQCLATFTADMETCEDVTCVENKTREWNECYDLCIPFSKNDEFDGDIFEEPTCERQCLKDYYVRFVKCMAQLDNVPPPSFGEFSECMFRAVFETWPCVLDCPGCDMFPC